VAVDPSWSSAASLSGDALNMWPSIRGLPQGRGGQDNPLEASIKDRLRHHRTQATHGRAGTAAPGVSTDSRATEADD